MFETAQTERERIGRKDDIFVTTGSITNNDDSHSDSYVRQYMAKTFDNRGFNFSLSCSPHGCSLLVDAISGEVFVIVLKFCRLVI